MEQKNPTTASKRVKESDEIDLVDLLNKLWVKRKFIALVTVVFLLIGLFIAMVSPVSYTATCTVVPQSNANRSNNLGGVAALMGLNLGTTMMSEGTLSPNLYPEIVKSVPFALEIMQTPIVTDKSNGNTITLYDYYTNKEYQNRNVLGTIKKYTIGLPGVIIGSFRKDESVEEIAMPADSADTAKVYTLNNKTKSVYNAVLSSMDVTANSQRGYVTISYSFPEAQPSAEITDNIYRTLEEYVASFKSEKLVSNLQFVEESYETARTDFLQLQSQLAAFQDANRGLVTASARSTETRLQSEYNIAFSVYNELAKQREQAKIAVKENQTILTLVNPVVVPHEKSAPRRSIILVGFLFFGFIAACAWVFIRPLFRAIGQEVRDK